MEDAFGRIVAIIASVFVLFFLPMIIVTQKMDNTAQAYIDNAVVEFVDNARATGIVSAASYEKLCRSIDSIQSNCTVEIRHSSRLAVSDGGDVEIQYYDYFKDDILSKIYVPSGDNQKYQMKNGDFIAVTVYNNSPTMGTRLYRMIMPLYNPSGKTIYATYSGFVGNNPE